MDDELKWLTPRKSWKYIPNRYQALVAQIVAALLFFNIFEVVFSTTAQISACGTWLRPTIDGVDTPGWFWDSGPFGVNMEVGCPRHIYLSWWELIASVLGLFVCGVVLRNAIKRMPPQQS